LNRPATSRQIAFQQPISEPNLSETLMTDVITGVSQPFIRSNKAMTCSELQFELSLYGDDALDHRSADTVRSHLDVCPLCRDRLAEYHSITSGLRSLRQPEMPASLVDHLRESVSVERSKTRPIIPSPDLREWLTMRLMPFSVGVSASLIIGFGFLTLMFSGFSRADIAFYSGENARSVYVSQTYDKVVGEDELILPVDYAQTRLGFGSESPSVNPQGTLIALTRSLVRGGISDDEVVVVADVFGNGQARIEEVVEPSRDRDAVKQLRKALQSDADHAPFLPRQFEDRPEMVRVVLKFQSVNVDTSEPIGEF
jgi:hypothetical protein